MESTKPNPKTESRSDEATSKKTLDELEDDEVTADLKDRKPVSPDGAFDRDDEPDDAGLN